MHARLSGVELVIASDVQNPLTGPLGADYFLDLLDFETHLKDCDLVISGEGRIDDQTLHGKLPAIATKRAAPVPLVAAIGRGDLSEAARQAIGLTAVHAIADRTDRNPANDPTLSAHLLQEVGATMPLHMPQGETVTAAPPPNSCW